MGFNFLEQPELPAPQVSEAQAARLLSEHYGLDVRPESLGSNQDKNFLVFDADDGLLGVLKVANPAFTPLELAAQDAAAAAIAHAEPTLRVAVPLPNLAGEVSTEVTGLLDGTAHVRLLRFLSGGTLVDAGYLAPSVVAGMGELAGRVSRALAGFHHPGLDRALQWDLRYGNDVVQALVSHVPDPAARDRLTSAATEAWSRLTPLADELPRQAVHLDLTDANVVAGDARRPDGIIDFGDLSDSWAVSEVAITLSSVLGHPGAVPTSILPGVKAFHAIRPLSAAEVDALWPLLVLRTAVLIVSGAQQVVLDPDNEYLTDQSDDELQMFERATSVPMDLMTAVIRAELGFAEPVDAVQGEPLLPGLDPASTRTLDLSATSEVFDTASEHMVARTFQDSLAQAEIDCGAKLVVTRFGEANVTRAPRLSQDSPDVVATGVSLWPAQPITLAAPWAGEVIGADGEFTLCGTDYELTVTGTAAADRVEAGAPLTTAVAGQWTTVSVRPTGAPVAPAFTTAELASGWLTLLRDPRPLLGLPGLPDTAARNLLARRDQSFARVQEHYYADPPQIERGRRHYLMSTAGRVYLDMVNNVTVLGHAHPRVAETAARQLRRLNTNSRFNYEAVVEFSERLAATLPDPLDTVFLVNSGSEASDLALRLAIAVSGHRDVIAVGEAYHGWTYATDAVSTSTADNPNALTTRPEWIHVVESPNSFRGTYRGDDAARYAPDAVAKVSELVAAGRPPAGSSVSRCTATPVAWRCRTVTCARCMPPCARRVVTPSPTRCRSATAASASGSGVSTSSRWSPTSCRSRSRPATSIHSVPSSPAARSRMRSARQGYFFSSTGGSPLSCAIGLTVLDVLRDEDLQGNALRVGGHLKGRAAGALGQAPDHRHRARDGALPRRRDGPRPGHPRAGHRGDRRDL